MADGDTWVALTMAERDGVLSIHVSNHQIGNGTKMLIMGLDQAEPLAGLMARLGHEDIAAAPQYSAAGPGEPDSSEARNHDHPSGPPAAIGAITWSATVGEMPHPISGSQQDKRPTALIASPEEGNVNMELITSYDELSEGGEIIFEIAGLEPHAEGGTYIARWTMDPPGSLLPIGENIVMHRDDIYSVFSAAGSAEATQATFEVLEARVPVTVSVDVRYRKDQVLLKQAHEMHTGPSATSQARLRASGQPGAPAS